MADLIDAAEKVTRLRGGSGTVSVGQAWEALDEALAALDGDQ